MSILAIFNANDQCRENGVYRPNNFFLLFEELL